jgi:hypothetical protein
MLILLSLAFRGHDQRHSGKRAADRKFDQPPTMARQSRTSLTVFSQVRKRAALCPEARLGCILGNRRGGVVPVSPLSNTAFSRLGLAR